MDKCKRFQYSELQVGSILCDGEFGPIYRVIINEQPFLYETPTIKLSYIPHGAGTQERLDSIAKLQSLSHTNILNVVSSVYEDGHPGLIYENAPYGALDTFKAPEYVPWFWKIKTLYEILLGVEYLSTQKPPIRYRELKRENIFLGYGCAAKIYGYLLSPWMLATYARSGHTSLISSVTFIAPESWKDINYPHKEPASIYSFGIIIWELMHDKPAFGDMAICDVKKNVVDKQRPVWELDGCPLRQKLYEICIQCWADDLKSRPTLKQVIEVFKSIMEQHTQLIEAAYTCLVEAVEPASDRPFSRRIKLDTNFTVGAFITQGTFGDIYCATRNKDKFLYQTLSEIFVEEEDALWKQLKKEFYEIYQLNHVNILKAGWLIFKQAAHSIVFEYAEHTNIRPILKKPVPWIWKIRSMNEIVNALDYLHTQEPPIGHYDLHLGNVYMDSDFNIKLCGNGLKTWVYTMNSRHGGRRQDRSFAYIPPECWRSLECVAVPTRDIYAFGILIWEFLHCEQPYESFKLSQIKNMICNGERPIFITENDAVKELCAYASTLCTVNNPSARLTSKELVEYFKNIYDEHQTAIDMAFEQLRTA